MKGNKVYNVFYLKTVCFSHIQLILPAFAKIITLDCLSAHGASCIFLWNWVLTAWQFILINFHNASGNLGFCMLEIIWKSFNISPCTTLSSSCFALVLQFLHNKHFKCKTIFCLSVLLTHQKHIGVWKLKLKCNSKSYVVWKTIDAIYYFKLLKMGFIKSAGGYWNELRSTVFLLHHLSLASSAVAQ